MREVRSSVSWNAQVRKGPLSISASKYNKQSFILKFEFYAVCRHLRTYMYHM